MERTDALNLTELANEFTARNEQGRCVFGKFQSLMSSWVSSSKLMCEFKLYRVQDLTYIMCPNVYTAGSGVRNTATVSGNCWQNWHFCKPKTLSRYNKIASRDVVNPNFFSGRHSCHSLTTALWHYIPGGPKKICDNFRKCTPIFDSASA